MKNVSSKTVAFNASLSAINTMVTILFSLVTLPYIASVLSVNNLGIISFSNSILSYFSLAAALGMGSYAVRTGSQIKDDNVKLSKFGSEIFSINVISTLISFVFLIVLLFCPTKVSNYKLIILIQSISLLSAPMALIWFYSIFEDFKFITIRNICIKTVSLICVLIFVNSKDDVFQYVIICCLADSIANIFNFIHSRKYLTLKFTTHNNFNYHKKYIAVFFVNSMATTIYVSSDITILGFLCNESFVAIYSIATKVYQTIKQVITAGIVAVLPRFAYYSINNKYEFQILLENIIRTLLIITIPVCVFLNYCSEDIILLFASSKYVDSVVPLNILTFAIPITAISTIFSCGVLISFKEEKKVMHITVISAIINFVFNFALIPIINVAGAAFSTLISEITVLILSLYYSRGFVKRILNKSHIKEIISISLVIFVFFVLFNPFICDVENIIIRLFIKCLLFGLLYISCLAYFKDYLFSMFCSLIVRIIRKI